MTMPSTVISSAGQPDMSQSRPVIWTFFIAAP
jgi:hypothetical protein